MRRREADGVRGRMDGSRRSGIMEALERSARVITRTGGSPPAALLRVLLEETLIPKNTLAEEECKGAIEEDLFESFSRTLRVPSLL